MSLNVFCWYCRGIMSSAYPLANMLDKYNVDIALISEHKLLPRSAMFMNSIHIDYDCYVNVDVNVDNYGPLKCGKAGTAILFKKSLSFSINQLPFKKTIVYLELNSNVQIECLCICVVCICPHVITLSIISLY